MYCNLKRQGDCEATFGENNTQIYMTQCSFLVLGGPIDSGSCPSVKSTFQFRNVLKIPSTTLHESSSFLVSFSDEFNSVTNMILCHFLFTDCRCPSQNVFWWDRLFSPLFVEIVWDTWLTFYFKAYAYFYLTWWRSIQTHNICFEVSIIRSICHWHFWMKP